MAQTVKSLRERESLSAGDLVLIPGLERSPGEGNGNPLWYSCLENSVDRGAWQANQTADTVIPDLPTIVGWG